MTQQKSEDRTVPKGRRKSVPTRGTERPGGGKAVPVSQESRQLRLPFATADHLANQVRANDKAEPGIPVSATHVAPKAKVTKRKAAAATMELGVSFKTAWRRVYEGRKSLWALSHDPVVDRGLRNAYFADRGLVSLVGLLRDKLSDIDAPAQRRLDWG